MSKAFIVLGNARSGTTLVTGILQALGVNMDADFGKAGKNAPKGFRESLAAHTINTEIFELAAKEPIPKQQGNHWIDVHWWPPELEDILAQKDKMAPKIEEFVNTYSVHELWGFKNPKTTITVDLFLPYLENPHFVVTLRNPLTNAIACHELFKITFPHALWVTNYYNYRITQFYEKYKEQYPFIFVNFEEIRNDPVGTARLVADFVGVELDRAKTKEIKKFVVRKKATPPLCWQSKDI